MKTKTILISLSSMLLLTCGTTKVTTNQSINDTVSDDEPVNNMENNVADDPAQTETIDSSTVAITTIDSSLLGPPWVIIGPPISIQPWEIITPHPYPFEWSWILTSTIIYMPNARPEDENDRIYSHLILARNCYQIEKSNRHVKLDLDISEEKIVSCSIESISNKSSTINTSPNWLNAPINISPGHHNFSIPFLEELSMDFNIKLNSDGENENYLFRI